MTRTSLQLSQPARTSPTLSIIGRPHRRNEPNHPNYNPACATYRLGSSLPASDGRDGSGSTPKPPILPRDRRKKRSQPRSGRSAFSRRKNEPNDLVVGRSTRPGSKPGSTLPSTIDFPGRSQPGASGLPSRSTPIGREGAGATCRATSYDCRGGWTRHEEYHGSDMFGRK